MMRVLMQFRVQDFPHRYSTDTNGCWTLSSLSLLCTLDIMDYDSVVPSLCYSLVFFFCCTPSRSRGKLSLHVWNRYPQNLMLGHLLTLKNYLCWVGLGLSVRHYSKGIASSYTYRTHTCGELTQEDVGKTVTLCGWTKRKR